MKTKLIRVDAQELHDGKNESREALREAGEIIRQGGLVAFPTETVYGLGGDALNPESSKKIYAAKGRPSDNPLIIHIADIKNLEKIVKEIPQSAYQLADVFWPGPLTMILPKIFIRLQPSITLGYQVRPATHHRMSPLSSLDSKLLNRSILCYLQPL